MFRFVSHLGRGLGPDTAGTVIFSDEPYQRPPSTSNHDKVPDYHCEANERLRHDRNARQETELQRRVHNRHGHSRTILLGSSSAALVTRPDPRVLQNLRRLGHDVFSSMVAEIAHEPWTISASQTRARAAPELGGRRTKNSWMAISSLAASIVCYEISSHYAYCTFLAAFHHYYIKAAP